MRTGAGAAVGVVAELVDVHAALGRGVVARDVVGDGCWGGLGRLLKGDGPADLGVPAEDSDCYDSEVGLAWWGKRVCGGGERGWAG